MFDILFDIVKQEIVFSSDGDPSSDFETTDNPSVQNGGILLYARVPNNQSIMSGIGFGEQVMSGKMDKVAFELSRWQAQATLDGATLASWTAKNNGNTGIIQTNVSYE